MANTRLTVVVRKDLQLPEGLLAAQATHMAMEFMRQYLIKNDKQKIPSIKLLEIQREWIVTPYISILAVNCYEDLQAVLQHATRENLPCELWKDTIPSPTFEGQAIEADVGVSIGPADFDAIKIVTNSLSLY